jgi:hypothetical protein
MTIEYVKDRKQFGVPVGAYQAVSHRCAQMLLETEKARSTAAFAAWTADADPEQLAEAAAMAKACASRRRARGDRLRDPGPWRHRLHLGGGPALALQARAARRGAARRRGSSTAPAWPASWPKRAARFRTQSDGYACRVSRYAAFLRGMNVGGHRLTNVELREHFTSIGFREVDCFRASGNVIFAGEEQPDDVVAERIETGLEQALGYAVPTFIRAAGEVRAIATAEPFAREHLEASTGKLQVAMLGEASVDGRPHGGAGARERRGPAGIWRE